jgi:hypothetical protein
VELTSNVIGLASRPDLEPWFAETAPLANCLLDLIESDRSAVWFVGEIIQCLDADIIDIMMVLARLTYEGLVLHNGIGSGYTALPISNQSQTG